MGDLWREILLIIFLIGLNAYFAASEIALISVRHSRIRQLAEEGNGKAKLVAKLLEDPSKFLATIQVGITLAGFLASAAAAVSLSAALAEFLAGIPIPFIAGTARGLAVILVTILIAVITLIFGELVPKRLALQRAEIIAMMVVLPINILSRFTAPVVKALTFSTNFIVRLLGGNSLDHPDRMTEEELLMLVTEQENLLDEEKDMIHSVVEFADTVAREIMIPRTDIKAIKDNTTLTQIVAVARETGHSRLPVYRETLDNIVGILAVKDIMGLLLEDSRAEFSLESLTRPAYFIPESKKVVDLFTELKQRRLHMAIVVDEYGGTAGLITIEDLLEEIVGDINDEHDPDSAEIKIIGENQALVNGGMNVEDVNEELVLDLPVTDYYETVGGFVLDKLGRIPKTGEEIYYEDTLIKIEKMEGNRIVKLRVTKHINKNEEKPKV